MQHVQNGSGVGSLQPPNLRELVAKLSLSREELVKQHHMSEEDAQRFLEIERPQLIHQLTQLQQAHSRQTQNGAPVNPHVGPPASPAGEAASNGQNGAVMNQNASQHLAQQQAMYRMGQQPQQTQPNAQDQFPRPQQAQGSASSGLASNTAPTNNQGATQGQTQIMPLQALQNTDPKWKSFKWRLEQFGPQLRDWRAMKERQSEFIFY
jgi:hypothetical protein